MKKVFAIMMMAAALAACTREEQPQNEVPTPAETPVTYTLTVKAAKGTDTRALVLDNDYLKAIWDGSEQVYAYLNDEVVQMTIDVSGQQSDRKDCILKGTFNQRPQAGDALTLKLNKGEYMNQGGTLAFISSNCDYAIANLTVNSINDGQIETTPTTASFENQQAIVKFSLKDKTTDTAIQPSSFSVKNNGTEVASVTGINANSGGVLFVAIPAISGTIDLTAMVDNDTYTYTKESVTFNAGEYSSITVKMTKKTTTGIDLSDESLYVNGLFIAQDGDVLTGTFPDGYMQQILIANGATVTLRNATIINTGNRFPGIALEGNATLILENTNTISANSSQAGILVGDPTTTLTIMGAGTLEATGDAGAGIGIGASSTGADNISCGNIVILGGTIKAKSNSAAAIGCGNANGGTVSCGNIIINGGTVEATGATGAAGIGTGSAQSGANVSCGSITISGGSVKATGGNFAASIGCGNANGGTVSCGDITISDPAQVTASRSYGAPYCIGPSTGGHCGTVTIYGTTYVPEPGGILSYYTLTIPDNLPSN